MVNPSGFRWKYSMNLSSDSVLWALDGEVVVNPPGNVCNNNFYSWLISRITSYIQDFSIWIWFWIWCCCRWGSSGRSPPVYNNNFYSSLPRPTHLLTIANCYTTESHNLPLQQNCLPREHKTIPKDFWEPHVAPKRARGSNLRRRGKSEPAFPSKHLSWDPW